MSQPGRLRVAVTAGLAVCAVAATIRVDAVDCGMTPSFVQRNRNVAGDTRIWSDAAGTSLLFAVPLNVNTDGARRSYSVDDFWGDRTALNNLCNAMSDACAGLSQVELRERRIATQRAAAANWPSRELDRTRIAPSIIAFHDGKPCPAVDGFLVSATALHRVGIDDPCDVGNYADAETVPALVLPRDKRNEPTGFTKRNAKLGDMVASMVPSASAPVFGVVGDIGPADKLGEASIAMNGALLGRTAPPRNYREIRGRDGGPPWTVPRAFVLVFPATRDEASPRIEAGRIATETAARFDRWGGMERFRACATAYGADGR